MDKNVGGVDLDELMKAREALDRERGIETDPNMYDDYGKDHSQPTVSETTYEDAVQEESQGYVNNQESNEGRTVDADNDGYAVKPGDNEFGWVADAEPQETKTEESQSFADAFENNNNDYIPASEVAEEPAKEEPVAEPVPASNEPKDLNMYDIFAEFEVKENANISSVVDVNAIANASADPEPIAEPAPVQPAVEPVVESAPVQTEPANNDAAVDVNDLVNEILAGFDLDAEPEKIEETPADTVENAPSQVEEVKEEQPVLNNFEIDVDGVHADAVQTAEAVKTEDVDAMEEAPVGSVLLNAEEETTAVETQQEEISNEIEKYIGETVANHDLIGGEENARIEEENDAHINKDDGIIDSASALEESKEESVEPEIKNYFAEDEENDDEDKNEEVVEEKQTQEDNSVSLVQELQNELFAQTAEPTTAPPSIETETKPDTDSGETEVITDYSKLKDILQQELEEAERAEVEKIEEVKAEVVKPDKQYADIESFNFVDEIVNEEFKESDKLSYLIGKDEQGKCVFGNFKEQYNLVIFGKEKTHTDTLVNSILLSLSLKNEVSDTNFIILDADVNSTYEIYNKSSYIFFNRIAKTNKEILDTLIEVSKELDDRYTKLASIGVKNIEQYNETIQESGLQKMPYLVVVFNNYTKSSQATDNDKIVACLHRVLKYGRIAGIYAVVVATNPIEQDEINYNLPSRIALRNEDDSVYTIGESGASSLTDGNDLLYSNIMADKVVHLKLPNISETERELLITGLEE